MKKLFLFLAVIAAMVACNKKERTYEHPCFAYDASIYELNTRQFTPEGTFAAAEAELPRLAELGYDIIWIMPIQPIGELERKGGLGSYYAIKDYCAFNPEFGTREDFASFLNKAHELGIKVILDWVANHTAPDHAWTLNEGWHMRDSLGNLVVNYDWYDIAELNYDNQAMRDAMFRSLEWWMDTIGVDGFRCDVAHEIPTDFWEYAFDSLRVKHPAMFTLCESENLDLTQKAFDMYYGWEFHHLMNAVAKQEKGIEDLWAYFAKADTVYPASAIRMNFTSNHDENSWAGTEFERMGQKAAKAMAMFTYIAPGMPLTYTGQEFANVRRLRFFDKDTLEYDPANTFEDFYKMANTMRADNPALFSNELGGKLERIEMPEGIEKIFACRRAVEGNEVYAFFNFSNESRVVSLDKILPEGEPKSVIALNDVSDSTLDRLKIKEWSCVIYCY
jgi:glycosidase